MLKVSKIFLGLLTLLPLVYIFTLLFVFNDFHFNTIQTIHFVMMALYAILLILYSWNVRNNDRLPDEKRALWATLIFVGSPAAQLIYWWYYIWPDDEGAAR
ncbi:MAG TPA: hypothetical protein VLC46_09630 [Thermoanaerobaculia bacterium]|nr:hypothetical protein [Thermoanaerobaculia bacterium]